MCVPAPVVVEPGVTVTMSVEVDYRPDRLPGFLVTGLPSGSTPEEIRRRVRTALADAGLVLPSGRVIVHLAPAGLPVGTQCDLPIALAVLIATGLTERN